MMTLPAAISPSALPLSIASRASCSAPSAIRSRLSPKRARASGVALDQFAVGGEHRRRPREIGEQPLRALGQRQLLAGALGRHHQNRRRVVGERDARAHAHQRAAEARAEAAQPFEPRRAALRQRAGKPRDLRGGGMLGLEAQRGGGGRRRAHRRSRRRSDWPTGCGCASALHSHAGVGLRACAASRGSFRQANWNSVPFIAMSHARITANESLIRRLCRRVHEAAACQHRQAAITLMSPVPRSARTRLLP